jgi:hypothetical protein
MRNIVQSSAIGALALLAGCTEQPGQYPAPNTGYGYSSYYRQVYPQNPFFRPYQPAQAYPQLPPGAGQPSTSTFSLISPAEASDLAARAAATPTQAPSPPPLTPSQPVAVDRSCGWWRVSNLWCGQ